jgi:hypothetical protein
MVCIENLSDKEITLMLFDQEQIIGGKGKAEVQLKHTNHEN